MLSGGEEVSWVQGGMDPALADGSGANALVTLRSFRWEAEVVAVAQVVIGLGGAAWGHPGGLAPIEAPGRLGCVVAQAVEA